MERRTLGPLILVFATLLSVRCFAQVAIFSESFDGLVLQPSLSASETGGDGTDWTATPPPGWSIDNSLHADGVPEFNGWTFVDPVFWNNTAGQGRDAFTKAQNVVAVADPDEWDDDDGGTALGTFNSFLTTPAISLAGVSPSTVQLQFDSSWRPFADQTGTVTVSFDGGPEQELLRLDGSVPEALNETTRVAIANPAGASEMVLEFGLQMAGNDWWWAIDNVSVFQGDPALTATIDRDTRQVSLSNNTGANVGIKGYSIVSENGAFQESEFDSLADAGRAGWIQFTGPGSTGDLSEGHLTTGTIADGAVFELGDAWIPFYEDNDDVSFEYVNADGAIVDGIVLFVGNNDSSFAFLDLNFDGVIDLLDWTSYVQGLGGEFSNLSVAQAYASGDLDGDLDNDHDDFVEFQRAFDNANGAGALAAMVNNVPEPSSLLLLSPVAVLLIRRRRSRSGERLRTQRTLP